MPKPVRSTWQAKGIELWDVKSLYSAEDRLGLLRHLGSESASAEQRLGLLRRSMGAAGWLRGELHYGKKPSPLQTTKAIAPIAGAAKVLLALLSDLDQRSRQLIEQAADVDAINNARCGGETPRMLLRYPTSDGFELRESFIGHERLSTAIRSLGDLERWTSTAPSLDEDREKFRSVRAKAIREAIEDLQKVWKDAWAKREKRNPTLKHFLPFVQAVLNPVLAEYGEAEDMRRATEDVLHGTPDRVPTGAVSAPTPSGGSA